MDLRSNIGKNGKLKIRGWRWLFIIDIVVVVDIS